MPNHQTPPLSVILLGFRGNSFKLLGKSKMQEDQYREKNGPQHIQHKQTCSIHSYLHAKYEANPLIVNIVSPLAANEQISLTT